MKTQKAIKAVLALLLVWVMIFGTLSCTTAEDRGTADSDRETADQTESASETTKSEETEPEETEPEETEPEKTETEAPKAPALTGEGKTIDLYLIAGQSNASGCTKVVDREAAYAWAPELETGFSHVHYAGNARSDSSGVVINRDLPWQKAKLGFGYGSSSYMGPEAGMEKALATYYNEESGKDAGLIKFAHGGTSLLNKTTSSNAFGNWVCPSYAKAKGLRYSGATGGLYRGLLEQVEKNIRELYEYGGYTNVNLKGIYWMQGCNDRSNPTEYQKAFVMFASDLRSDLSALMLELTGGVSDCGASEMAVFVGTVSETFDLKSATTAEEVNRPFIEMQKRLPDSIENCYVVDNSQYAVNRWNTETNTCEVLGSDRYHWNQADALEIGENVGKLMIEKCFTE